MTVRNDSTLRVVSYNVLRGGMGRADPIAETLLYLAGDVVGLCEAFDIQMVEYWADRMDCEHVVAESRNNEKHVALLSKWPIEQMVNLGMRCDLDRAAMEAVLNVAGQPLRVVLVHLAAGIKRKNEKQRLDELNHLLEAINDQPMPTVLLGDLNASARTTPFDPSLASPKAQKRLAKRDNKLNFDVTDLLDQAGWVDTYHRAKPDCSEHTFSTAYPALRFDYIYLSGDLAELLIDADVETGGFTPYCSDHYPIWADIQRPTNL